EHEEDAHRERELVDVEELDHPAPLIERGERDRDHRQRRPAFARRGPREADVQQQQVGEQRHRTVLAGRQQNGRREAADETEQRDVDRVAPNRQQHRDDGHQREQHERRGRGNQIPERVRGKEAREQNRGAGGGGGGWGRIGRAGGGGCGGSRRGASTRSARSGRGGATTGGAATTGGGAGVTAGGFGAAIGGAAGAAGGIGAGAATGSARG